ncbi:hypothetical protein AB1K54_14325 [Microbacterium sp. BWT-B31]|uniref:hypothetical protein n=1 Tax=Microbacterium sp. BWT-B31 TaxID=3232072 RepID=UPI003529AC81
MTRDFPVFRLRGPLTDQDVGGDVSPRLGVAPSEGAAWLGHTLAVYLQVYFPERGADGIAEAAEVWASARAA